MAVVSMTGFADAQGAFVVATVGVAALDGVGANQLIRLPGGGRRLQREGCLGDDHRQQAGNGENGAGAT